MDLAPAPPAPTTRWRMLLLLAAAELLGMSVWFAANAVRLQLAQRWHLGAAGIGALATAVQLGFVAGTAGAALLNLADLGPARVYFAGCAVAASLANLALLASVGFPVAIASRFLTGFFLAGVYPPGMKMIATWFREGRGLAIGIMVGALGLGKGLPYLVHALGNPSVGFVVVTTSLGTLLAAALVLAFYHEGPHRFERRAFDWGLVTAVVRHRETALAIGGYLGHMWELYAMWTWIPAFLAASLAFDPRHSSLHTADLASF